MSRLRSLLILWLLGCPLSAWAVTASLLTASSSTTDASSYTTASITPSANKLVLVAVVNRQTPAGSVTEPTLSGNSLTYVRVNTQTYTNGAGDNRTTVFRAMGASPTTGAITIDYGGTTQANCNWSVVEFGSVDTSGTNGSGAVVQSAVNTGTSTSPSVTLAAFGSASNATYGAFGDLGNSNSFTVGSGFTELSDVAAGGEANHLAVEWVNANDTSVDGTINSAVWGVVGIEIKAAAGACGRLALLGVGC